MSLHMKRSIVVLALLLTACGPEYAKVSAEHIAIANKKCEKNGGPENYEVFGMAPSYYEKLGGVWKITCKNGAIFDTPGEKK